LRASLGVRAVKQNQIPFHTQLKIVLEPAHQNKGNENSNDRRGKTCPTKPQIGLVALLGLESGATSFLFILCKIFISYTEFYYLKQNQSNRKPTDIP